MICRIAEAFKCLCLYLCLLLAGSAGNALEPIPDRLVVLTFDDSVKSHFTEVRPILLKHGFGATFFITEGWDFATNKDHYMTWEQIAQLHQDGFEIGNHTRDHMGVTDQSVTRLSAQLQAIEFRCLDYGIPAPVSFAWPGNAITEKAFATLRKHGIQFARRGGAPEYPYKYGQGVAYEPGEDHPLLIPSAGDGRPFWVLDDFVKGVSQAKNGHIAVMQFHGVPDIAHPWVNSVKARFAEFMQYLADNAYTVIALRDLETYVDYRVEPDEPFRIIEQRQRERAK